MALWIVLAAVGGFAAGYGACWFKRWRLIVGHKPCPVCGGVGVYNPVFAERTYEEMMK